jgi:hypothetical protein
VISEEKIKIKKNLDEHQMPSDGNSSHDPSGEES